MPTLILERKDIEFILNKIGTPVEVFEQNLIIYLQSILTASDKPAWINNPDSSSISKLLEDNSNL